MFRSWVTGVKPFLITCVEQEWPMKAGYRWKFIRTVEIIPNWRSSISSLIIIDRHFSFAEKLFGFWESGPFLTRLSSVLGMCQSALLTLVRFWMVLCEYLYLNYRSTHGLPYSSEKTLCRRFSFIVVVVVIITTTAPDWDNDVFDFATVVQCFIWQCSKKLICEVNFRDRHALNTMIW